VEKEIPQESNDLYSIYQQNVHEFFNEFVKSISQYQQSISCGIMLNPALAFNQNFENKPTVVTPAKMTSPAQQTKIEKAMAANQHPIQNQTPSELPPLKFSSIISSQEIQPKPTSKKTRKSNAETFWKNEYALNRGKLPRMTKVQDEQTKIFANNHSQDLSFMIKDEIVTKGECQNCGKLMEDSLLTHCSNVCLFEDYLKSKSVSLTLIET
jgi:hypothetical protein